MLNGWWKKRVVTNQVVDKMFKELVDGKNSC